LSLSIPELVEIIFVHAKMMTDFMQNSYSDLLDESLLAAARQFDILLKDIDDIRHRPRVHDASLGHRMADVKAKKQFVSLQFSVFQLTRRRPISNLHPHLL